MSRLDDILVPKQSVLRKRSYDETKQEIKDLMLELIGEVYKRNDFDDADELVDKLCQKVEEL